MVMAAACVEVVSSCIVGESEIAVVCVCLPTNFYGLRSPRIMTSAEREAGTMALNHEREQVSANDPASWDQVADRGFTP